MLHNEKLFSTFLAVLLCGCYLPLCQMSTKICVIPSEHSPCNCSVPCHTFDYYLSHAESELYSIDDLTVEFLSGVHQVKETFFSSNRAGLHLTGNNAMIDLRVNIKTSWFTLYNGSNITFSELDFLWEGKDCDSCYIVELHNVTDLKLSNVSMNSNCGGGVYLTSTQNGKIELKNVTFSVWLNGLNMSNVNCFIDISHCFFYGSQHHLLLWAQYTTLTPNSALSIQHCEFHNGSGSVRVFVDLMPTTLLDKTMTFSLRFNHVICSTPNGSDISVIISDRYRSNDISVEVTINNSQLHQALSSGVFLEFATYYGKYNINIDECTISFHREGALRIALGNNLESNVFITNSVVKYNQASPYHFPVSGMIIKGPTDPRLNPITVIENVTFESNTYVASASIDSVVTVMLFFVHRVTITNCQFSNNTGTALYLENSTIFTTGTITFTHNTAHNGAAIYMNGPSVISTNNETRIAFTNNKALHTGGAIYINSASVDQIVFTINDGLPVAAKCFISVKGNYKCRDRSCILQFEHNMAKDGGEAIFGGNLDQLDYVSSETGAIFMPKKPFSVVTKCIGVVNEMSMINTSSASAISSSPSRVCLCVKHVPDCLEYNISIPLYPGQSFNVSALTVGQHFGTARGSVYAQILNTSSTASVLNEYRVQTVGIHSCNDSKNILTYRVTVPNVEGSEVLVLTTEDVVVSDYVDKAEIARAIYTYKAVANKTYVPIQLLTLPVYITLDLSKCPTGFVSSESGCVCDPLFRGHSGRYVVTCNIDTQSITRQYSVWVDASNTTAKFSKHCQLLYCNSSIVHVNVTAEGGADVQCINHHSGTLCGGCQTNYSLAIGSSNCLPHCSDQYLLLLLFFAAAGVILLLFIKYLNLTITQGMISGFIFYGNIVQSNKSVLFTSDSIPIKLFAAFIAWLNLDMGIETCFSEGLDMYTKTWLQFVFPLYLWTLAGGIVLACRYSRLATKYLGNNAVHVLATIFLLSYNKLLRIITTVYSSSSLKIQGSPNNDVVWTYDGNISYLGSKHALLFAASTAVFLFLWLPFTLCILLGQWLQRCNHYRGLRWIGRIHPLLEAFYGPLKDRHRYWIGILLLARVAVILPAADPFASTSASMFTIIVLCILLLLLSISLGGPYKRFHLTLLESAVFANLALFATLSLYLASTNKSQDVAVYVMVGSFSIGFLAVVGIQLFVTVRSLWKRNCYNQNDYVNLNEQESFEEERN